ncbi:eclosion hormone [Culex quinquefasciatus]|uniref:Eclosion hormone n=1 Tax=Culex quinquefasciatus TaxID=7176 RepID=B0X456_CULQU|nr:eclosion hormone [Culex quinquefasciatus]|eukprot:XP_001864428.1 eclosion hormone [Culex quinquefasciatus]
MSPMKFAPIAIVLAAFVVILAFNTSEANPQIDLLGGYDLIGVCITNCAQCKKMFGEFFEGHLCAEACIQFKGKMVPDCEDINSIAPFLNKLN